MVRKRTASEIDDEPSPFDRGSHSYHHHVAVPPQSSTVFDGDLQGQPNIINPFLNIQSPSSLYPLPSLHPPPIQPPVCGLSGLPVFSSDGTTMVTQNNHGPVGMPDSSLNENDSAVAATAWVDGLIRDLIGNSSTDVTVAQLIQSVREIIQPSNPNLASVIEYRLRSLSAADSTPPSQLPPIPCGRFHSSTVTATDRPPFPSSFQHYQTPVPTTMVQQSNNSRVMTAVDHSFTSNEPSPIIQFSNWEETRLLPVATPQSTPPPPQPPHRQQQPQFQKPICTAKTETTTATTIAIVRSRRAEELRKKKRDEEGLHLLTLLLQCAEAVSGDNLEEAKKMLVEISELSTPYGTSAQRVAAYFSEAITARILSSYLEIYSPFRLNRWQTQKLAGAFQVFNGICPFIKFSHFTANQAIQEAFEREEKVHIIDLDVMQGLQWPGLFHILASRPGGPPSVKLTGLGTNMDALEATGKRLSDFAETLGLPFEFFPVAEKVGNLDVERLNVSKKEAVAVHWLHHSLYDVVGSDTNTLWLLQR